MNQPVYLFLVNGKKYIDFKMLLLLYANPSKNPLYDRSTLYRYINNHIKKVNNKSGIGTIMIGNKRLFLLDDIFSDIVLLERMQNITAFAKTFDEE